MNVFKLIGLMFLNLFREARRVPQTIASGAKERKLKARRGVSEGERLDRIRQPWKYAGK